MSPQEVDEDGTIWFLSDKDSEKNKEIERNSSADLLFAQGLDKYMSLHGKAVVLFDKAKINELWGPATKAWFASVDDPSISIIKFTWERGQYWDKRYGEMVQLAKMGANLFTGDIINDSVEGMLNK